MLGKASPELYEQLAGRFTVAEPTKITSIEGWIGSVPNTPSSFEIALGTSPGSTLFSGTVQTSGGDSTWQGLSGLDWEIGAGTYWVTFSGVNTFYGWMPWGAANPLSAYAYNVPGNNGWLFQQSLDFGVRINDDSVTSVPDSGSTFALLGLMLSALLYCRRKASIG